MPNKKVRAKKEKEHKEIEEPHNAKHNAKPVGPVVPTNAEHNTHRNASNAHTNTSNVNTSGGRSSKKKK